VPELALDDRQRDAFACHLDSVGVTEPRAAVELAREGVSPRDHPHIQHTDLGTTSTYLQGIDPSEIIDAVRSRRPPTISATAGLTL
jgi:hypothetical protein